MFNMISDFEESMEIKPMINIGCLFDIPTGTYIKGKHGENILNGGMSYITGMAGRGNTYKSTIAHYMVLAALNRLKSSGGMIYDTENSLSKQRIEHLSSGLEYLQEKNVFEERRLVLTDKDTISGSKWFDQWKMNIKKRKDPKTPEDKKNAKKLSTPFIDSAGKPIQIMAPFITELDSLSAMNIDVVEDVYDKSSIGDSKLNTEALKTASAKSQMMVQLPDVAGARSSAFLIMTAHVGDQHQLDPYAPPAKKLSFLKGKVSLKRVPENFTFYTNNLWYSASSTVLVNQGTKAPEFPRNKEDDLKGDTDLMMIGLVNLRAKSGPTGLPIDIVVSQRDGVHVGLSQFAYLKQYGRYGLGGHDRSYYLELVPDINMQRTTVRNVIDTNEKIRRALEITSEMAQMLNMWHHLESGYIPTPDKLFTGLLDKGYDWDVILTQTRGYWVFKEEEALNPKHFLSTMDLIEMYHGTYHPYWWDKVVGKLKK